MFNINNIQYYKNLSELDKKIAPLGRGKWPGGTDAWGYARVDLSPISVKIANRTGLTIHGGKESDSAGCVDLTSYELDFLH